MTRAEYWKLLSQDEYLVEVYRKALELKSDGCSGVLDLYVIVCYDHDIGYRTHRDVFGNELTRDITDLRLKWGIQFFSPFWIFSPMAQWRYLAVHWWAQDAWDHKASICYKNLFGGLPLGSSFLNPPVRTEKCCEEQRRQGSTGGS